MVAGDVSIVTTNGTPTALVSAGSSSDLYCSQRLACVGFGTSMMPLP